MTAADPPAGAAREGLGARLARSLAWSVIAVMAAFLVNNYLTYWLGLPGLAPLWMSGEGQAVPALALAQAGLYAAALAIAIAYATLARASGLRADAARLTAINAYLIRAMFWAVLLVGLADSLISFMRIEDYLEPALGNALAGELARSPFRGAYVHMPLIAAGFLIAALTRTLGFHWLALLVVVAEALIVICRFVFSYEQAFMADLVRFWYAALFLFASAHTLLEDGHVRVDVFYASFSPRTQGVVNAVGSVLLGMGVCWIVLAFGMGGRSTVINSPLLAYEVTQSGFGLYVKYLMSGFLAVFAVSMMIQFASAFLSGVADARGLPGRRVTHGETL